MVSYTPSKKDGAEKAPKTKQVFFENPRLQSLFNLLNQRFNRGKTIAVLDEVDNQIYVLYPRPIAVRKTRREVYVKTLEGSRTKQVEAIGIEYSTKIVYIWVNSENKMEIEIETEVFAYNG